MNTPSLGNGIAIIGMAGRFPGAETLDGFWRNLRSGVESVSFFRDTDVQWLPIEDPPNVVDPAYVKARAILENSEWFDAAFFGMNPREAEIMDPQHRVFLECAWEALEHAGCVPETFPGSIGVFAGASINTYLYHNLLTNHALVNAYGLFGTFTSNEKDFLPTRVAYKLNLRGPCINVQTACSTSLVAVCLACQNLQSRFCDVALAGGVSLTFPTHRGHHHVPGGIMSKDGHCRSFSADATGTVMGNGAGVVVLKRLDDAIAAGDQVLAVIKGIGLNNDGAVKIGFTAPSGEGQRHCIAMAHAMAGFDPETVGYIEAHGTGTPLGDPVEIDGLVRAFPRGLAATPHCAIGSVKTNIGHLDVAAGIAGLMKTVLALEHEEIPPSLHFAEPNPHINFDETPFFVNRELRPWKRGRAPRRAGVSSFGIGGTNAHVAIEEAPVRTSSPPCRGRELLVLSARTPSALEAATKRLANCLEQSPRLNLADVAFTLQVGRRAFEHRRAFVVRDRDDAVAVLRDQPAARVMAGRATGENPGVVFMFPGQGAQAPDMARACYESEPLFREIVDHGCRIASAALGLDLRAMLFPARGADLQSTSSQLAETRITQPALFLIEYALARLWMQWGIQPSAMIGHSIGEYVAACLAGTLSFDDALAVVLARGQLMQEQARGAMLAVRIPPSNAREFIGAAVDIAAINTPTSIVVSGAFDEIATLEKRLNSRGISSRRLATSHAFHSALMEPALGSFRELLRRVELRPPQIPWVSNLSGTWITPEFATSPDYWSDHLRHTVRFADGVAELARSEYRLLLEVGPGSALTSFARQHPAANAAGIQTATCLAKTVEEPNDTATVLQALGQLWVEGVIPEWLRGFHAGDRRQIVTLPTYPFERTRCWIEPGTEFGRSRPMLMKIGSSEPARPEAREDNGASPVQRAAQTETLSQVTDLFWTLSNLDLARSADRTFTELGFDSLLLAQASAMLAQRFNVSVPFRHLRDELCTLRKLADHLDQMTSPANGRRCPCAGPDAPPPGTRRIPATDAQREIWSVSTLGDTASMAYIESALLELKGSVDLAALCRALHALAARHESLRTTFSPDGATQIVSDSGEIEFSFSDFSADVVLLPNSESDATACIDRELSRPFDLVEGPLCRVVLVRAEAERYVVGLIVHHIICDGWSLGILMRELTELYSAEVAGRSAILRPAPSFSAYVERAKGMNSADVAAGAAYWAERFADNVPVVELPSDRPRPANRDYAGATATHPLPPDLALRVKQYCVEHDTTVFTAMLAAFAVLLHRLTGQDDVVIGIPAAVQALDGEPDLVGHFANLLPIRSQIHDGLRFAEHLSTIRHDVDDALEHWRYPFTRILQQLKVPRDARRVPLTSIVFNTHHLRNELRWGDIATTPTLAPKHFVNFDLNFTVAVVGESISVGAYYSAELFDAATIERWLRHFEKLLESIVSPPDQEVSTLSVLSQAERARILKFGTGNHLPYDRTASIRTLFEAQVRRTPQATAIIAGRDKIGYGELNAAADAIARRLRATGVGPDALVGVMLPRTPQLLIAILGILKAGGGYVPLDPNYPTDRLEFILRDARVPIVLTSSAISGRVPVAGVTYLSIDEGPESTGGDATSGDPRLETAPTGDNLAYIIYTSGSTGRPKGVAIPQRNVVALVTWAQSWFSAEELDGVLFSTSVSFDISVFEIFCPLCLGGKIVIADNLLQLTSLPAAHEVRLLSGVPSAVAEIVRSGLVPSRVTTVSVAGEPCPATLVDALYRLPHVRRVFELYGPTETTVYSTGAVRTPQSGPSLGRPFPNEQILILDRRLELVPIGVQGELYIGGDKLARGYLHRPDLTAERFIDSPFKAGARLYRTGDLARWRDDGTIESLGRADHQVKVWGFRIELGEIEAVLAKHPAIAECVVMARPDRVGQNRLLAYAVHRPGRAATARELLDFLARQLPEYMLPTTVTLLERWPLTTNGKLDRRALAEAQPATAAAATVSTVTITEDFIRGIWREVLGLTEVGLHDNFFELGGHSLGAMQVITRIRESLGINITWRQFFAAPTVAGIASAAEQLLISDAAADEPSEAAQAIPAALA